MERWKISKNYLDNTESILYSCFMDVGYWIGRMKKAKESPQYIQVVLERMENEDTTYDL